MKCNLDQGQIQSKLPVANDKQPACSANQTGHSELDTKIRNFVAGTGLGKEIYDYPYGSTKFKILIFRNPERHSIDLGNGFVVQCRYAMVYKVDLPKELSDHIRSLIKQAFGTDSGGLLGCGSINGVPQFDLFEKLDLNTCRTNEHAWLQLG